MNRVLRTHAELALRQAAKESVNVGRSMTHEAIVEMADCSSVLVDLFAKYVESTLPPKIGRGGRLQVSHVELSFGRVYRAIREFMDRVEDNEGEEE